MDASDATKLRITIVSASGLHKSDYFGLPDVFAIASVDEQTVRTGVVARSLAPCWNERFVLQVTRESVLTVRVFDAKKFEKKERGFLGVMRVAVGQVVDLSGAAAAAAAGAGEVRVTRSLLMAKNGGLVEHGEVTVEFSVEADVDAERTPGPGGGGEGGIEATPALFPAVSPEPLVEQDMSIRHRSTELSTVSTVNAILPADEGRPSSRSATSKDAVLAWNRKFAEPQVRLERNDPSPFSTIRRLGGGGMGIVFETKLDGIPLALKRTYTRRLTDHHLSEIKILTQITEKPHKHIVELIGSYIHKQQGGHELGLLIWPVAQCDLAAFLQDIDSLGQWIQTGPRSETIRTDDLDSALETLSAVTGIRRPGSEGALDPDATRLYESSLETLRSSFGCIANAVAWLHQQGIRHRDLKPSQILLSQEGLWLTDFGWSKDISELAQSATSGGDNITLRYQSPERAQMQSCGRPEDIFSLGCIFIEMAFQLARPTLRPDECTAPWKSKSWSFQGHLDQVHACLRLLQKGFYEAGHGFLLTKLVAQMLALNPNDRPSVDEVIERLSSGGYFSECCAPARSSDAENHRQSKSSIINYYAQRCLAQSYSGGLPSSAPAGSQESLCPSVTVINAPGNTTESYQPHRDMGYVPWHVPNSNTGIDPTLQTIPYRYSGEMPANQTHLQANVNQIPSNTAGSSSGFNTPTPLASTDATAHHPGLPASYMSTSTYQPSLYTSAPSNEQGLTQSLSDLNINTQNPAQTFHNYSPNTAWGADVPGYTRAATFGSTTPTSGNGGRKMFKQIMTGLDRQLNGLVNDDRSGRGLISSGPAVIPGLVRALRDGGKQANVGNPG